MLGLRTAVKSDTGASPAEFLYGSTINLPGEFFVPNDFFSDPEVFIEDYREHMRQLKPVPVIHRHRSRPFYYKDLHNCTHVFLRKAGIKKSLERPYAGPFEVIERVSNQDFKIEVKGSPKVVSTELLKPAHFIPEDLETPDLLNDPFKKPVPVSILKNGRVCKRVSFDFASSEPGDSKYPN